MGQHDDYGKLVMRTAVGAQFTDHGPALAVSYGPRGGATVDGVVGTRVAVEIESRVSKQVRGAVLDLICHAFPKKLLALLPVHMTNPALCAQQCEYILARFVPESDFRVVVLVGSGDRPALDLDAERIRRALAELST